MYTNTTAGKQPTIQEQMNGTNETYEMNGWFFCGFICFICRLSSNHTWLEICGLEIFIILIAFVSSNLELGLIQFWHRSRAFALRFVSNRITWNHHRLCTVCLPLTSDMCTYHVVVAVVVIVFITPTWLWTESFNNHPKKQKE